MTGIGRVPRQSLADLAHKAIRDLILSGEVRMGDRLVETQLSESLGISRAPIREALQRLVTEGLTEERAHLGTFVRVLSTQDAADTYNVRLGLETVALRLLMARHGATDALHGAVHAIAEATAREDVASLVAGDLAFHRAIATGSGSPLILRLFAQLEGRMLMMLTVDDGLYRRLGQNLAADHQQILDLIEAGEEKRAVDALATHIVDGVRAAIGSDPAEEPLVLRPTPS